LVPFASARKGPALADVELDEFAGTAPAIPLLL
jgi:hypothetical protein